jgi:nifR3 family TIM-barrel protein
MSKGFWKKLNKPFFVLAPMADVTDAPFRQVIAKYGKPDVTYTEFVSADGLFLGGYDALVKDLEFTDAEQPIVAQFFTSDPKRMEKAAELAVELGFDGIDINMGCPDRSIEKQGAGSALMKNPELAKELVEAAKQGAGDIPVSVKTRVGYNKDELDQWLPALLSAKPAVITIHARTRKQMSKVPADWNYIKRAVEIRDTMKSDTLIVGNGDVIDIKDARKKAKETGADGVMLGRAIFGNPWLFDEKKGEVSIEEKLKVLVEHTKLFEEIAPHKNFNIMKKHYKAYVYGWDGAKELRIKLMEAKTASGVEETVNEYLNK